MEGQDFGTLEIMILDNNSVLLEDLLLRVKFLMANLVVELVYLTIIEIDEESGDVDVMASEIYLDDSGVFHQQSIFSLY